MYMIAAAELRFMTTDFCPKREKEKRKMSSALEWKSQGNAALKSKDFEKAVECYSEAIKLEPSNHTFYSNRSAAYVYKKDFGT
tara:strand:+ start:90 stop:338 length:249 start_codon:yes stop_codon:yes gene_type:complete